MSTTYVKRNKNEFYWHPSQWSDTVGGENILMASRHFVGLCVWLKNISEKYVHLTKGLYRKRGRCIPFRSSIHCVW